MTFVRTTRHGWCWLCGRFGFHDQLPPDGRLECVDWRSCTERTRVEQQHEVESYYGKEANHNE